MFKITANNMIVKGTYILLEIIGSGKAGDVFKAKLLRDTEWGKMGDTVAIKQYKSWVLEEPGQAHRIYRELSVGIKLNSPHIVKTYDVVKEDSKIYLVMEHLKGATLKDWLENNSNIPFKKIIQISIEFLNGLKEFHNNKLIHRDLKPENIMVTDRGIVLMDLGVIKEKGASTMITGDEFIGTIKYSAPEYLFGEDYDERIDIFSYGLILYELIFGESLIKQEYWSKMVVESFLNKNIGPPEFIKKPESFSENENEYLWLILNCCLGKKENRLFCNELIICFMEEIWENLEVWDKFETHKLQFSKSNLIISNFLFICKFQNEIGFKFKEIQASQKIEKNSKCAAFIEEDGHIIKLKVVKIDIKELPEEISYLKKLKHIHFQATRIDHFPDSFGQLKELKTIYMVGHRIKELPECFGGLISLEFLNIISFYLEKIHPSFSKLKKLKYLYIDKITDESADIIGQLKSLEELRSFKTNIRKIPPSFQNLRNLVDLSLIGGILEDFTNICSLKKIEKLTLSSCQIKIIPPNINNLINLKKLELWSNSIEIIPKSIGQLKSIELIDLHNNPIKELPEEMNKLQNLKELNIGKTAIKELPPLLLNLSKIETIHIDFGVSYNEIRASLKERGVNLELTY
ncbi:MAG: protein kinase [Promethearchaeota archaeon]